MNSYSTSRWSLLLISRPCEDERLSWPCWLTYIGRFTHINGYPSATGPVQTSESSPVRDRRSTTEPPNQPSVVYGRRGGCGRWHVSINYCSAADSCLYGMKVLRYAESTKHETDPAAEMFGGRLRKQRLRSSPAHSWTPMMPKMKKTKKQRSRTLPSIGSVSSSSITSIRRSAITLTTSTGQKIMKKTQHHIEAN